MKSYFSIILAWNSAIILNPQNLYAENHTITHTIESETAVSSPSDRKRTKLGVGEEVTLTFLGGHKATWTLEGEGKIDGGTAAVPGKTTVTYTAPEDPTPTTPEAKPAKITAKCDEAGGGDDDIEFTVVAPNGVKMEIHNVASATFVKQTNPYFKISYQADTYLLPDDVNFKHVKIKEGTCNAVATDYFATQNGNIHTPVDEWDPASSHVAGKGTRTTIQDSIVMSAPFTPYASKGKFTWSIPYYYKVNDTEKGEFKKVDQIKEIAIRPGSTQGTNEVTFSVKKAGTDPEVEATKPLN